MPAQIQLGEITIDVTLKDVKNVHLSVHPPAGHVRITAPERMSLETIRVFAISKLAWIKQQQRKLQGQERETPREVVERESHYLWGKRFLLALVESEGPARVELEHRRIVLRARPGTDADQR
ncbi:MAG: M48 family metallopeptidase, partial [Thermoanaerobaculia bacterium]|nr:M48 family metallopeptidase [Thermoanaerobaculia bacterium]